MGEDDMRFLASWSTEGEKIFSAATALASSIVGSKYSLPMFQASLQRGWNKEAANEYGFYCELKQPERGHSHLGLTYSNANAAVRLFFLLASINLAFSIAWHPTLSQWQ